MSKSEKSFSLMLLGSMSSVGKSLLTAGLCRLYARRGWSVAPFKAQNMSNNAAVCAGGEIGRAQAVQAYAAGIEPSVHMNPILLKPEADSISQVVVQGKVWKKLKAADYYPRKQELWSAACSSFDMLRNQYQLIILEGAGSPAELNLKKNDIVNLAMAHYAQAPCLLVGDIDRGGIFAQLLGTLSLLNDTDRQMIKGLVANKFRGDETLFKDGLQILENQAGVPVLGLVPYLHDHGLAEEDAAPLDNQAPSSNGEHEIVVIHLPHISNFDDADPLKMELAVNLRFIEKVEQLGHPVAIILPGSKNTLQDLLWLRRNGLADAIIREAAAGTAVVGLCGGFQMLGRELIDEGGVESGLQKMAGLGLLDSKTHLEADKTTTLSRARMTAVNGFWASLAGEKVNGYEIHNGVSESKTPLSLIKQRDSQAVSSADGCCSPDGKIWGTYLHGIFENDRLRSAWLESLGIPAAHFSFNEKRTRAYDLLADVLEKSLNISQLDSIIRDGVKPTA